MTKKKRKFRDDYEDEFQKKPKQNDHRKLKRMRSALRQLDVDGLEDISDYY